ncbi:hypothetical protein [Paracoccus rhizosphaerae]|uniref:Uncharacterized protein n=1 Tax=Paracoccus rhizosphaerae TaxID=1133347 RepID=A0ABV6CJA8_9RHOB|nr:hypothetical protein [Paracoccus rhizosphaerae]
MAMIYFSGGTSAEVTNVRGEDPVKFDIPPQSITAFHEAFNRNEMARFSKNGPKHIITRMSMVDGEAVPQIRRGR